jgi:hypothetical protein
MDPSLVSARSLGHKTKGKRKRDESNIVEKKEDVRGYFTWNLEIERVFAEALRDQRSLGRQSDGAWKAVAYNAAADVLSARFNVQLIGDNVKNRIKLWRGWYGIVSDILSQSGFDWDAPKCMINVEDENAWNEYVKVFHTSNSLSYFSFCICAVYFMSSICKSLAIINVILVKLYMLRCAYQLVSSSSNLGR